MLTMRLLLPIDPPEDFNPPPPQEWEEDEDWLIWVAEHNYECQVYGEPEKQIIARRKWARN